MRKRIIIIIVLVLLVGVGGLVFYGQYRNRHAETWYSGTIEDTEANLSFQVPGRVTDVLVREGQAVVKDQVLAQLDASEYQSRLDQSKANLEKAKATQAQLETELGISEKTLPADMTRAAANARNAGQVLDDAQKNHTRYEALFKRGVVTEKERDAVRLAYDNARARLDDAQAQLSQARASLKRITAIQQEIETAKAQAQAAKSSMDQAQLQLGYTHLRAPIGGILTSRDVEPGEVVNPNRTVLTVADLSHLDLKIFVEETAIGKVKPGQRVDVKVDTFPDKAFAGSVAFISPQAEFTPKIIQTQKERVKLVYMVKVAIPNPNLELKSGMPADAYLR